MFSIRTDFSQSIFSSLMQGNWAPDNMFLKSIFQILHFLLHYEWTKEWFKGSNSFLYCDVLYTTYVHIFQVYWTYSFMEKDQSYRMKRNSNCLDIVKSYCHFINHDEAFSSRTFRKKKYSYHVRRTKLIKLLFSRYFSRYFYTIR